MEEEVPRDEIFIVRKLSSLHYICVVAVIMRDCGLSMVTYAECLSYGQGVPSVEFNPNVFRTRDASLLWNYNMRKKEAKAQSDDEASLRPVRKNKITSVTEVLEVRWLMILLHCVIDKI
ncbi:uncharacterized protein LOC107842154 [Capsicum annuum]|uniref:uncharacterized protein LOC107842154 n=1 Tax=Capsicum annuum TaxID=4072 RepID=UPI0007BF6E48|nr:uncharacterized protein LOC107842154 [Capsicum annuum]